MDEYAVTELIVSPAIARQGHPEPLSVIIFEARPWGGLARSREAAFHADRHLSRSIARLGSSPFPALPFPALAPLPQVGNIAGSYVEDGVVLKGSSVIVKRLGRVQHEGKLKTLKNVKADVQEMVADTECGIQVRVQG